MKFSIITATWNSAASIAEAQRSIAAQNLIQDDIEWIVVDGASTDETLDVIRRGPLKPAHLVSEPDRGIYDALNKGVRMATGDVISFLHADDFFDSPSVVNRVGCALRNTGAEALYGDLQYVKPNSSGGYSVVRNWRSGIYYSRNLKWGWMPPHPALFLKKEVYERAALANGEFFDTSYSCSADYDFMLRIFSRHNVEPAYLKMVLVRMCVGGISNRSLKHIIQKSTEDWRAIRANEIGHVHTLVWKNVRKLGQFLHMGRVDR
jgi:glycosyltransferase